jgi:molybdopterin-guanine dinucleotide biosynthesis protein A
LQALLSTLIWAGERNFELVATFSCDTPFLPSNLVRRLRRALKPDCDCAVALHSGAAHPTCALWKTSALKRIQESLNSGTRSLHGALADLKTRAADFSDMTGGPGGDPFFNINRPSEMVEAEGWLRWMSSVERPAGLRSKVPS